MKRSKIMPLMLAISLFCLIIGVSEGGDGIVPQPKKIDLKNQTVILGPKTQLSFPEKLGIRFKSAIDSFNSKLAKIPVSDGNLPISIKIFSASELNTLPDNLSSVLKHKEGYIVEINSKQVTISSAEDLGILHGLTTLEDLLSSQNGKIKQGLISDWPDLEIRALHLPLDKVSPTEINEMIGQARFGHFNTLILQLRRWVNLPSMKAIAKPGAWTKEQFLDVIRVARENGLEPIPEIKLLTHQEKLFGDDFPDLMFNMATYDPRKEETYKIVLPILDELIDLIQPKAIHIGHDEVAGYGPGHAKKWLRPGEKMLSADLFLKDTERLFNHLKSRGVETWMWGDMLLAPEDFPTMYKWHLHGRQSGYTDLLGKLPKQIVITDWHYKDEQADFPSAKAFKKQGHKVLGATWERPQTIRNFSRYIANLPGEGMIATSWSDLTRKEFDAVKNIIKISAECFWNAK